MSIQQQAVQPAPVNASPSYPIASLYSCIKDILKSENHVFYDIFSMQLFMSETFMPMSRKPCFTKNSASVDLSSLSECAETWWLDDR